MIIEDTKLRIFIIINIYIGSLYNYKILVPFIKWRNYLSKSINIFIITLYILSK